MNPSLSKMQLTSSFNSSTFKTVLKIVTSSVLRRVAPVVSPDGGCWTQLESQDGLVDLRPLHPALFSWGLHLLLDH